LSPGICWRQSRPRWTRAGFDLAVAPVVSTSPATIPAAGGCGSAKTPQVLRSGVGGVRPCVPDHVDRRTGDMTAVYGRHVPRFGDHRRDGHDPLVRTRTVIAARCGFRVPAHGMRRLRRSSWEARDGGVRPSAASSGPVGVNRARDRRGRGSIVLRPPWCPPRPPPPNRGHQRGAQKM
jgi:hypothetical protein